MLCLGLETSCDETAAAIVHNGTEVRSDVVATQVDIHRRFGGVVPELASRNHLMSLFPVIDEALRRADVGLSDIELIAVTQGPGLQGALLVGVAAAKAIAAARGIPLVGVNHLEGHLFAIRLTAPEVRPPFLGFVVSGGHTALYQVDGVGEYRCLASTRDDAAGEAFDKVARILGMSYPGGRRLDELSQGGDASKVRFPRALRGASEWSFSGLKTAAAQYLAANEPLAADDLKDFCASFQEAIVEALVDKLLLASKRSGLTQVVLGGGVAANSRLRTMLEERCGELQVLVPPKRWCTDNGAMIAAAGTLAYEAGRRSPLSLAAQAGWRLGMRP